MIKLDAASQTVYTTMRNGKSQTDVVDTLVVRYVEMNLTDGSILAIIDRGTQVTVPATDTVPEHKDFVAIDTPLWVDVRADGSFSSRDGAWQGNIKAAGQITAGLKQAFDGFLLASGAITGTTI